MNVTFLDRFNAIVAQRPQHTALESPTVTMSYEALRDQAACWGATWQARGVGPETIVGIALERSPDFIAAVLGLWWAGAAFLPLDVHWPHERFDFVVGDAQLRCAITNEQRAASLSSLDIPILTAPDAGPSESYHRAQADDLAYVIYTSGSTGRPKGVMVEHRGIVNLLDEQIRAFELDGDTRSLWMLNPAFDASVSDIGTVLFAGGTLVIDAEHRLRDPIQLTRVLHERRITYIDLPPLFLTLLDAKAMPATLRSLCIGGEPAPAERVRAWATTHRVVNVYGPTEATVCTSLGVCDAAWNEPLIGQPMAHTFYRIEPVNGEPSSLAETEGWVHDGHQPRGELLIRGPGLARGYLRRPELTASKFVTIDGQRWYRTGDRVRRRSDGEYVFLGRVDRQFKWRGQLIEPHEIEQRLCEQPDVRAAAVLKRLVAERETLVAFVETDHVHVSTIRNALTQQVPPYMVPNHFELLPCLPRTANGKIDYAVLRSVSLTIPRVQDAQPSNDIEAMLMHVWAQVLRRPTIDRQAGFLSQGGDSLRVFECVAQLQTHGLAVTPAILADDRPLYAIAESLRHQDDDSLDGRSADVLRRDGLELLLTCDLPTTPRSHPHLPPRNILLTGATGFLGSYVLSELVRRTTANVVCLVRARSVAEGLARIGGPCERVSVVCGDLRQRRLGLSDFDWDHLAQTIDTIAHLGAEVNMVAPYSALRAANVVSSCELLNLMAAGQPKRLHDASTLSVFVATDRATGLHRETDDLTATRHVYGGYAQSKWAAEVLLRQTNGAWGDICFYRFGLLTGEQRTGQGNTRDLLSLWMRGVAELGGLPQGTDLANMLDMTPVDFAAAAFVQLSQCAAPHATTYHIAQQQGTSLGMLVQAYEELGQTLPMLTHEEWWQRWNRLRDREPTRATACLGLAPASFPAWRALDLFQATHARFDVTNTKQGLRESDIAWPIIDGELLQRYWRAELAK